MKKNSSRLKSIKPMPDYTAYLPKLVRDCEAAGGPIPKEIMECIINVSKNNGYDILRYDLSKYFINGVELAKKYSEYSVVSYGYFDSSDEELANLCLNYKDKKIQFITDYFDSLITIMKRENLNKIEKTMIKPCINYIANVCLRNSEASFAEVSKYLCTLKTYDDITFLTNIFKSYLILIGDKNIIKKFKEILDIPYEQRVSKVEEELKRLAEPYIIKNSVENICRLEYFLDEYRRTMSYLQEIDFDIEGYIIEREDVLGVSRLVRQYKYVRLGDDSIHAWESISE